MPRKALNGWDSNGKKITGVADGTSSSDAVNKGQLDANSGYAGLPAGVTLTVRRVSGVWPARPVTRTDLTVVWAGVDPSPVINTTLTGTTGMYDGIDFRDLTP